METLNRVMLGLVSVPLALSPHGTWYSDRRPSVWGLGWGGGEITQVPSHKTGSYGESREVFIATLLHGLIRAQNYFNVFWGSDLSDLMTSH